MAGWRETKILKPIDKATFGVVSEFAGRNVSERRGSLETHESQRLRVLTEPEGSTRDRNLTDAVFSLWRGGSDGTQTRTRFETGEARLVPRRNPWSKVVRITEDLGKSNEDERVADGPVVAEKRGNARGAKGPYCG